MPKSVYVAKYNSDIKYTEQEKIVDSGIIACVYCLGEGYDIPLLDGVVFAENMTSNIRIVQSALRASRKDAVRPHKIAKIIVPTVDQENWMQDANNCDMKKIKEIVVQLGSEDESIITKIRVYKTRLSEFERQNSLAKKVTGTAAKSKRSSAKKNCFGRQERWGRHEK